MSTVGSMEVKEAEGGLIARGKIETIKHQLAFLLEPVTQEREKAPTHKVVVKSGERWIKVGDAWENIIGRGDKAGQKMFSIRISDPDLPEWMDNLASFPLGVKGESGDAYEIVRSRERQNTDQEAA